MLDVRSDAVEDLLALNALLLGVLDLEHQLLLIFPCMRDRSDFVHMAFFTVLVDVGAEASEAFLLDVDGLVVEALYVLLGVGFALLLRHLH